MFTQLLRVPASAEHPSFDQLERVTFWRWLTSSKSDRLEWTRRRKLALDPFNARLAARVAAADRARKTR
jgi:hypothetical protein